MDEEELRPPLVAGFGKKMRGRTVSAQKKKSEIKLADYGVTFGSFKKQLEKNISFGYRPHFGYENIKFDSV